MKIGRKTTVKLKDLEANPDVARHFAIDRQYSTVGRSIK